MKPRIVYGDIQIRPLNSDIGSFPLNWDRCAIIAGPRSWASQSSWHLHTNKWNWL
jgi:hypothetical protein